MRRGSDQLPARWHEWLALTALRRGHGAEIEIDSEPGKGATMRLIVTTLATSATPGGQEAAALGPAQRLQLLLIDDDPLLLESLR